MNGGLSRLRVENGTGSTAVLIPRLRAGTGVDDGDGASLVDKRNMSMTKARHVVGECSKVRESGAAGIDVFIVRFPRAAMDNQNFLVPSNSSSRDNGAVARKSRASGAKVSRHF